MDNNNNNNPRRNPENRSSMLRTILLYVVAIGIVFVFFFMLVKPFSNTKVAGSYEYNGADIRKNINESGETTYEGELANVLANEQVTLLQTQVASTDNSVHNVAGYFYKVDFNTMKFDTTKKYQFTARLDEKSYSVLLEIVEARVEYVIDANNTITNTVKVDANGDPIAYYGGSSGRYSTLVPSSSSWTSYLPFIIISAVLGLGAWFLISRSMKSIRNGMGGVNEVSQSRARRETNSKIRFKDVAGCDEVKAELVELVDYFKNAEKYTRLGAKLPKGVLLVGPPGTGKTLLAKAVAGEAQVPFYSISGSDFVEMYVGVGASRVRDMFKTAKKNAPCLVFIDEIDAVGRQRGAGLGGGNDEREQTLNQLLVEMDGFEDNSGVIIVAATNRADVLDPALTRAGRFDRQITVDLPDKEGREAIFKVHARNKKIAKEVDFGAIAARTTGFSGADIANIINDAAILAVRANRELVTTKDIDEAIDRSIAGPAKSNKSMLDIEKKQVAYHESGHAIVGLFLPHSDKVQKVTIVPRGRTGGHVMMTPEQDRFLLTKNELMARITGYLAGRTSEEVFFDDISTGASNDIEVATRLAKMMVTEYGMSPLGPIQYEQASGSVFLGRDYNNTQRNFSSQIAYEIDKEVRTIIEDCHLQARKLIEEHRDDVTLMAETLLKVETLTADQISYLLEHRELPPVDEHILTEEENTSDKEPEAETVEGTEKVEKPEESLFSEKQIDTISAVPTLPYYGQKGPACDQFNEALGQMMLTEPQCIVLIAVGDQTAKPYTLRSIKAIGAKFAGGRRVAYIVISPIVQECLQLSPSEFGSQLEKDSGREVMMVLTDLDSISRIVETKK